MQRANAAVARLPRRGCSASDEAAGALAMEYPAAPNTTRCGRRSCATATPIRPSPRAVGRRARAHPRRHRRAIRRSRRDFATDRDLLRHPPRALPARDRRARIPISRRRSSALVATTQAQQARAGARRRQPEEHPARTRRPGVPRRRMRLVGRSGVRPRLLPQPPAAEVPVDAVRHAPASSPASTRSPPPTSRRVAWEAPRRAGSARGAPAARAVPRAGRRQVAGRVHHAAKPTGTGCGASRARCSPRPVEHARRRAPGLDEGAVAHDRHHDRLRARPPRLGQPRPPDGRGRGAARRRRASAARSRRPAPRTGTGEALDLRDGGEAFGGYDVTRAVGARERRDRARARRRWTPPTRPRSTAALIELDGTPNKSRLGGNAMLAVSMAVRTPPPRPPACRCIAISAARDAHAAAAAADPDLRRRRARRAARRHPGLHGRLPAARRSFAEALGLDRRGLPRRRRADGRSAARCRASPTRAAGGRPSPRNEQALETLVARDRARRLRARRAGRDRARRRRLASSAAAAATGSALEGRELDSDGHDRAAAGWIDALSDRLDRGSARPRTTPQGFAAFTRARRRRACRSSATTSSSPTPRVCAKPRRAARANAVLLKPNQRGTLTETLERLDGRAGGRLSPASSRRAPARPRT